MVQKQELKQLFKISLCLLFFFFLNYHAWAQVLHHFSLSGNNANIFIRDHAIDGKNNHVLAGDFASDTFYLNGKAVFENKGLKNANNAQQSDGYLISTDSSANILFALQIWADGSTSSANDASVKIFNTLITSDGDIILTGFFTFSQLHIGSSTIQATWPNSFFIICVDADGKLKWQKLAGLKDNFGTGAMAGLIQDKDGDVLICGNTFGTLYIDTATAGCVNCSAHDQNVFVIKLNTSGDLQWVAKAGGNDLDYVNGICADAAGRYYLTGTFSSNTLAFGTDTLYDAGGSKSGTNMYIACLDKNGQFIWGRQTINGNNEQATAIACDKGYVYTTGNYDGSDLTIGTTTLNNSVSSWNLYLVKYSDSGKLLWVRTFDGDNAQFSKSITVAGANILLGGNFNGTYFKSDSYKLTNNGKSDVFVVKLDTAGKTTEAESFGGTGDEQLVNMVPCTDDKSVFVSGTYNSASLKIGADSFTNQRSGFSYQDAFIARLKKNITEVKQSKYEFQPLSVYPNPFHDILTIAPGSAFVKGILSIYDMQGRKVYEETLSGDSRTTQLSLSTLPEGLYSIVLSTSGEYILTDRVVKY